MPKMCHSIYYPHSENIDYTLIILHYVRSTINANFTINIYSNFNGSWSNLEWKLETIATFFSHSNNICRIFIGLFYQRVLCEFYHNILDRKTLMSQHYTYIVINTPSFLKLFWFVLLPNYRINARYLYYYDLH